GQELEIGRRADDRASLALLLEKPAPEGAELLVRDGGRDAATHDVGVHALRLEVHPEAARLGLPQERVRMPDAVLRHDADRDHRLAVANEPRDGCHDAVEGPLAPGGDVRSHVPVEDREEQLRELEPLELTIEQGEIRFDADPTTT